MKALTVLSVLLLSTNLECFDTSYLAHELAANNYHITSSNGTIILENDHFQRWIELFVDGDTSCVVDEGELS